MKVLELFAGTRSIGRAFEKRGHKVFSVDWNAEFQSSLFDWADGIPPMLHADISTMTKEDVITLCGGIPDVVWASPDCATYSVAALFHHRRKNDKTGHCEPITDYAKFCDKTNTHVVELIQELNPRFYFIENPRACLRTMPFMQGLHRHTVTYCQYGDNRQKPTDIWTNHPCPMFKPPCSPGDSCHEAAPRGSKTGTQGLAGAKDRGRIPELLCQHIVNICEMTEQEITENRNNI